MDIHEIEKYIELNPEVLLGKPVIRDTRIPVYIIVDLIEAGYTPEDVVDDYPDLSLIEVEAALAYNARERELTEVRPLFKTA